MSRGSRPRPIACRDTENAPEITAWEAMTVAAVANSTIGSWAQVGNSRKNGFALADWSCATRPAWPR
ncbi:MAG TPA: hypothetical protein VH573_07445 [Mycobacteriales bacterium]